MKITFLGTNGWYDTATGNTLCVLIETGKEFIILDAGNGFCKLDGYLNSKKPAYLFLSHFHLDHIIGLHALNKFSFKQRLNIYGQKGTTKILNKIIDYPFTIPFSQLPFKTTIHELGEGSHRKPFYFECRFLLHASKCLGYRFQIEDKIVTFCTDTGYCKDLLYLSRGADLFIEECSFKPKQKSKGWPHLNPEEAALVARKSGAKKLALVHFDAGIYKSMNERKAAGQAARKIFKATFIARDNQQINL